MIDVSAIATAKDVKGGILRFRNFDLGGCFFDTAVAIDALAVVGP